MTGRHRDAGSISALLSELAEAPDRSLEELLPELRAGDVVAGRFELLRELGRGGFGLVFEARDRELGRTVAFKAIRPIRTRALEELAKPLSGREAPPGPSQATEAQAAQGAPTEHASLACEGGATPRCAADRSTWRREGGVSRLLREEAEAAARLNHPNVVTLHDSGVHDGTPYLIMELLHGETLAARLRRGPLPADEALAVAVAVAQGLVAAHAAGVLHRDLKPGNVFLTGGGAVKLVDFGLASIMGRASLAAGTPAYMAPEQLRGEAEDARADVFGAAAVLFETLSGTLPYPVSGGRSAVLDPGPPPTLPIPDPPPELVALLTSALARDPASRPQDAAGWLAGLRAVERAYAARAAGAARAFRRRRVRQAVWAGGAVALLVAGLVAWAQLRARDEAERALRQRRVLDAAAAASDPLVAALLLAELPDDAPPRALEVGQRVLRQPIPAVAVEAARGGFALAVSADGARAALGQRDGLVTVLRTDGTGAPLLLRHAGGRVNGLAFTPDGARLLAAGQEGAVHLHRLDGTEPPASLALGAAPLTRLVLSPDGRRAAAASQDGRVRLLSLEPLRLLATALHDAPVLDLAFTPDGLGLAAGDGEGLVRLLDAAGGATLGSAATGEPALALAWAPEGARLAVGGQDGRVRLLSRSLAPLGPLGTTGPAVTGLAWSPDGARLAAASLDGLLRLFGADGRGEPVRRRAHRDAFGVAWSPAGDRLLTHGFDGLAYLWAAAGDSPPAALEGPAVLVAAFGPDGRRVIARLRDGALRVWPADAAAGRDVLVGHQDLVDTVEWSRDGTRLLTAGHDGTARIWERATGQQLVEIRQPGGLFHSAAWDRAEALVLTSGQDGVARVWRARDGALAWSLPQAGAPLLFAAWSPDGARIATAGLDGVVRVHAADGRGEPRLLRGHEGGVTHVAFSADGRTILSASQLDLSVRLWRDGEAAPRTLRADRGVYRACLSPRGELLAVAEVDGPLRLFRTVDLGELPPVQAWPERLWAPAWSPDGRRLALASGDGSVRIVAADGRGEPAVLRGHQGLVTSAAYRPDGRELASSSADGTVRIAAVDWRLLREKLSATTSACLSPGQRVHLLGEPEGTARQRHLACERRHGRGPPLAPPPPPPAPGGRRAGLGPPAEGRRS